ncbi:MAG: hypoxanthine phosphoribosyltransferase [Pirellulales bacterium]
MKTLLTKDQLHAGVVRMAGAITACYESRPLTVVGVLTGSVVVVADLIRLIDLPVRVGMIAASSYRGTATTPGQLVINDELMLDIAGRDVLLVDDIFDTGHTLVEVMEKMRSYGPASLRTAVLLKKKGRQEVDYKPDFVGFEIPNEFVVGYGLDYADMFRNLPDLAVLEPAELQVPAAASESRVRH